MKGDGMRKKNQKEIYCTVNMDTPYGQHVMECMELLKGRFDLSASRIMQDALIAYESETRGKFPSFQMPEEKRMDYSDVMQDASPEDAYGREEDSCRSDVLGVFPSADPSEYQM